MKNSARFVPQQKFPCHILYPVSIKKAPCVNPMQYMIQASVSAVETLRALMLHASMINGKQIPSMMDTNTLGLKCE